MMCVPARRGFPPTCFQRERACDMARQPKCVIMDSVSLPYLTKLSWNFYQSQGYGKISIEIFLQIYPNVNKQSLFRKDKVFVHYIRHICMSVFDSSKKNKLFTI